jgi:methyltransferase (TIGR00027 family)
MRDGPSLTAAGVAIARGAFDRPASPGGDGGADRRLAATLLDDVGPRRNEDAAERNAFVRTLAVRTRFFDDAVMHALGDGVTQIVILGAGYDTRALRFRTPGVRFFEVDHPSTQRDKLARLEQIGATLDGVAFVAADFTKRGLDDRLGDAGYERQTRTLFTCEGVFRYLPEQSFRDLLGVTASIAAAGSVFTASISTSEDDVPRDESLDAIGEHILTVPSRANALEWVDAAGWTVDSVEDMHDSAPASRPGRLLVRAVRVT